VPAVPGIPNSDMIHFVFPGDSKLLKTTLVMQHHSITIYVGMLNTIALDPGLEHGLGLSVVSHGNNVQWFHCTV
jgi:hypothetical protein